MHITIFTTGGTLDKVYFDANSEFQVGDPGVAELLAEANVTVPYTIVSLMRKDSLELTDEDRQLIFTTIAEHENDRFLITHGTDTMIQTARHLLSLGSKNTVVLTGALNPARFVGSDAVFNIGCAVAACQSLERGIHIVMNGRIWEPLSVRKNVGANRFESATTPVTDAQV